MLNIDLKNSFRAFFVIFDIKPEVMAEIKIKVDPRIAKAYSTASVKEQEKVSRILNEVIEYVLDKEKLKSFFNARHVLSQEARDKGITPEILEEILNEKI